MPHLATLVAVLATLAAPVGPLATPAPTPSRAAPARHGAWPLTPRPDVVRGFDVPATPWAPGHRGVDLLGHPGAAVRSALPGTVTFAAPLAGRGVVVVDHTGVRTTYEPVRAGVAVGDVVGRGGVLGRLQRAGGHCFPRACLHWGLVRGETYLNPLTLVGAGPVRLLPLLGPATTETAIGRTPQRLPRWSGAPSLRVTGTTSRGARSRSGWPGSARWW